MTILPRHKDVAKSRLKMSNPWHLLAVGFGSGLSPIVPGTMGSLAAIPFWYVIIATLAFFGIVFPAGAAGALGAAAAAGAFPVMPERTCLTISSIFTLFISMIYVPPDQRMQRLSVITQRLLFVNVLALVSPSPVRLAIVNVQKPSPPNPSAE